MLRIPDFIESQLDPDEIKMAEEFVKAIPVKAHTAAFEETCSPGVPYYWRIDSDGLGDWISIVHGKRSLQLVSEETIRNL